MTAGTKTPGTIAMLLGALALLRRSWLPVSQWLVVTGAAAGLLLIPLFTFFLVKTLSVTGSGAVLNYDIAALALSLPGLLLLVLYAVAISLIVVVVVGGPVLQTAAASAGRSLPLHAVGAHVLKAWVRVPGLGALKLALLAGLALPLVGAATGALGAIALLPFGADPVRELLGDDLPGLTALVGGVAVLAVVAFVLYVRWSLSIHILLLEGVSLRRATRESARRVGSSFLAHARVLLAHHVSQALLLGIVSLLLGTLGRFVLKGIGPDAPHLTTWVAVLLAVQTLVLGAVTLFGIGREISLLTLLYRRHRSESEVETPGRIRVADTGPGLLRGHPWRIAALVLVALLAAVGVMLPQVAHEFDRMEHAVSITAHRGSSAEAPENTLAAIRLAMEDGADYAEFDVLQAADGTLAVLHDVHLGRVAGLDRNVYDVTREDLAKLEVGAHFDEAFRGEPIPTLEQVIETVKGRMRLNIELKTHGHEKDFVPSVIETIRRFDFAKDCVITSLDMATLQEVRRLAPDLRIGMIITVKVGQASALDVDFYSVQGLNATTAFIRSAHDDGREVHVWTVNDEAAMTRFADRRADNLITDYPRLAREVLDDRTPLDELLAALTRLFR